MTSKARAAHIMLAALELVREDYRELLAYNPTTAERMELDRVLRPVENAIAAAEAAGIKVKK